MSRVINFSDRKLALAIEPEPREPSPYTSRKASCGSFVISGSTELYTPPAYVELVRETLGGIDLDPASHPLPQSWIKAGTFWQESDSGHMRAWFGRVFCNPPYGKNESNGSVAAAWANKMRFEYGSGNIESGILLVNSVPGYNWYEDLWVRYPVCCVKDRICFIKPDGTPASRAVRGQTFVYFGRNPRKFKEVFSRIGRVIPPLSHVDVTNPFAPKRKGRGSI